MPPEQAGDRSTQIDVGIPGFWSAVSDAPTVALLLDYDGTLAPFHVDRLKAVPAPGAAEAISAIRDGSETIVALVSGRPVAELLTLMPDPGVTIIGTHGFEVRDPGKDIATARITDEQASLLDRAFIDASKFVGKQRTERKAATVAAHFRGLDRIDARQFQSNILERWLSYADTAIVEVRQFNGGVEMRALGRHKGSAVAEFLDRHPESTLPVYVGDDETDEDAFRAVKRRGGFGIRVGDLSKETEASGSLKTCEDVVNFLHSWIGARTQRENAR